jgi:hypothetical protein
MILELWLPATPAVTIVLVAYFYEGEKKRVR